MREVVSVCTIGNRYATEEAERHESLFPIGETVIFKGKRLEFKYPRRIDEVETVIFEILPALRFVPGKTHRITVYTLRQCVNWQRFRVQRRASGDQFLPGEGVHPRRDGL